MSINGQSPAPRRVDVSTSTPTATKVVMASLWLAAIDGDELAINRALALLPDDAEVRGIALGLCRIGLATEPRLRCDGPARQNAVELLEAFELSHRVATGRL